MSTSAVEPMEPTALSQRALDVVEWGAKFTIALGSIWLFLRNVAKPAGEWYAHRRAAAEKHRVEMTRKALAPELAILERVADQEDGCMRRMEAVMERQEVVFEDLDMLLKVSIDAHERLDETNDLLNAVGFDATRRVDEERRVEVERMISRLTERRKERRRELEERRVEAELAADLVRREHGADPTGD